MIRALASAAILLVLVATPVMALQTLIPSPFPGTGPGVEPLNPRTTEPGEPQSIIRDPYPQILGDNSQGNPPIARAHRHQHLVPGIYKRKYRVERP